MPYYKKLPQCECALAQLDRNKFNLSRFWQKLKATSVAQLRAFNRTLGSYLWAAMQENSYDAATIYALSGIDPTQLDAYLRGVKFPTLKSLSKLAEILSLPATTLREVRAAEMAAASYHFFTEIRHVLIVLPDDTHAALQQANTIRLADIFQRQLAMQGFSQEDFATFEPFAIHLEDALTSRENDNAVKHYRHSYSLYNYGGSRQLPNTEQIRKLTSQFNMDYQAMQRAVDIEQLLLTYSKLSKQHHGFDTQLPPSWQKVLKESADRTVTFYFISQLGTAIRERRMDRRYKQYSIEALATAMQSYFPAHTSPDFIRETLLTYEHHQASPSPQIRRGLATVLNLDDKYLAAMIASDKQIIAANILHQKAIRIRLAVADLEAYRSVATQLQAALKASGLTTKQVATRLAKFYDSEPTVYLNKRLRRYLRGELLPQRPWLKHLHQILDLDLDKLFRDTKIEKHLRYYQKIRQEHGELRLPRTLRRALDHAAQRLP